MAKKNLKPEQVRANVVELAAYRQRSRARELKVDVVDRFEPEISMADFDRFESAHDGSGAMAVARRATMLALTRSSEELLADGDSLSVAVAIDTVHDYLTSLKFQLACAEICEARLVAVRTEFSKHDKATPFAVGPEEQERQTAVEGLLAGFLTRMDSLRRARRCGVKLPGVR
jgi:hypothetical protein